MNGTTECLIRDTTADDVGALQALVERVALERAYLYATTGFTVEQTAGYLAHVRAGDGVALVATDGARLLGWIDIAPGDFEGLAHAGRVGMGVAIEARGRGIGRALLHEALRRGFERFHRIEIEVFASNSRAHALYRRLGFVEEGRRRQAWRLDGKSNDIVVLGLLRHEWAPMTTTSP